MWHLAPSIFLQERAEASCPTSCSDTAPSAPSKSKTTPGESCWSGSLTAAYLRFLSGTMCKPFASTIPTREATSNGSLSGVTPWLSQADFPAKTYPSLAKGPGSRASDQDSGKNLPGLLAKYDPATHSLKTAQLSLLADSMSSSPTLPRSGWMQSGRLYPLPMRARPIVERESGYWRTPMACDWKNMSCSNQIYLQDQVKWQTPVADDAVNRIKGKINSRGEPKLSAQVLWRTPTVGMLNADRAKDPEYANRKRAKGQTITLADQVKWPTPRARDAQPEGLQSGMDRMGKYATCSLPTAVALWPTPTVCGNHNRKGASATSGDGLATVVAKYSTPQARDYRTGQQSRFTDPARTQNLNDQIGGQLNPVWVCWLMNFPLNWFQAGGTPSQMSDESLPASKTGLANSRPLAMPKCRCNVLSPGES